MKKNYLVLYLLLCFVFSNTKLTFSQGEALANYHNQPLQDINYGMDSIAKNIQYLKTQDGSNKGKDFWLASLNTSLYTYLFVSADVTTIVKVSIPQSNWSATITAPAGKMTPIQFPSNITTANPDQKKTGIHVETDELVALYVLSAVDDFNSGTVFADAAIVLPTEKLDNDYIAYTFPGKVSFLDNAGTSYSAECGFSIIAIEDNTQFKINSSTITLNKGEVYRFKCSNRDFTISEGRVKSLNKKPFALFSGMPNALIKDCTNLTQFTCTSNGFLDLAYEQVIPLKYWGKEYIIPSLGQIDGATARFVYRIYAAEDSTHIKVNGKDTLLLLSGEAVMSSPLHDTSLYVTGDKPIAIIQSKCGSQNNGFGDAFMVALPPLNQMVKKSRMEVMYRKTSYYHYNLYLIVKTSAVNQLILDDVLLPSTNFKPLSYRPDYSVANVVTKSGIHFIENDSGFIAVINGYGSSQVNAEAYSFSSGLHLINNSLNADVVYLTDTNSYDQFDRTVCINDMVLLMGKGDNSITSWNWDLGDGSTASGQNINHSYPTAGKYTVTLTAFRNSTPLPTLSFKINVGYVAKFNGSVKNICAGQQTVIDAGNAGASYLWSTGATTQTLVLDTPGVYKVKIYGMCDTIIDSVKINLIQPKPIILADSAFMCGNYSVTLLAPSGFVSYLWELSGPTYLISTRAKLITTQPGTYYLTVVDSMGCTSVDSLIAMQINNPKPTISMSGPDLVSSSLTNNQWKLNGTTITGATFQTYTPTQNGNYTVSINDHGCIVTSDPYQVKNVGIDENSQVGTFDIFPNPFNGITQIDYSLKKDATISITIYNVLGSLQNKSITESKAQGYYSIYIGEDLSPGLYYLYFKVDNDVIVRKMVKTE